MHTCTKLSSNVFDADYIEKLRAAEPATANHFESFFAELLTLKFRCRLQTRIGVAQLTDRALERALEQIRSCGQPVEPRRLPQFMNGIANEILLEYWRDRLWDLPCELLPALEARKQSSAPPAKRYNASSAWGRPGFDGIV